MINNTIFIKNTHLNTLYYRRLNSKSFENAICECVSKKYNVLRGIETDTYTYYGAKLKCEPVHFKNVPKCFTVVIDYENIDLIIKSLITKPDLLYLYGQLRHIHNFNEQMGEIIQNGKNFVIFETKYENVFVNYSSLPYDVVITSNIYNFDLSVRWISQITCERVTVINIQYFIIGNIDMNINIDENVYVAVNDNKNFNFVISNITNLKNMKNKKFEILKDVFLIKIK